MSIGISQQFIVSEPISSLDFLYGPYDSLEEALDFIPASYRMVSKRFVVVDGEVPVEYIFSGGIGNEHAVKVSDEFSNDLGFPTEEFTAVLPSGSTLGKYSSGDVVPSFSNANDLIKGLGIALIQPTRTTRASVSLSGGTTTVESGYYFYQTLIPTFDRGVISSSNGSGNTYLKGPSTGRVFSGPGVDSATGLVNYQLDHGTNTWSVTESFSEGLDPYYDSTGAESSYLDSFRGGGTVQGSFNKTAVYARWNHLGAVGSAPTTSSGVRVLSGKALLTTDNYKLDIPAGTAEVTVYLPDNYTINVLDEGNLFLDVSGEFNATVMVVNDAAGRSVDYNRWTMSLGSGYPSDTTFDITLIN
jgi:hypothetical protein